MGTKAQHTSEFIIRTVAPVFNKKGYSGTSMADLTAATGLTKGAIYGNFTDKNELAVRALVYNIKLVSAEVEKVITAEKSSIDKLFALSKFYKTYYVWTHSLGGCPILNIGIDANHQNPELHAKVKKAIHNLQGYISQIIDLGKIEGEIKSSVDSVETARRIFSLIEGGVFMSTVLKNKIYMEDVSKTLDGMIVHELQN